jgi:hypothetical protein
MKTFSLDKYISVSLILITYIRNYGIWILGSIFIIIFIGILNLSPWIIILSFFIILIIFGYGRAYPSNKNIYRVVISEVDCHVLIYYFVLWKSRSTIPFNKLHVEFEMVKTSKNIEDKWRIHIGKKPWPTVGVIRSSNGHWSWDKEQMIDLSKELYKIKQKHETWKPEKSFLQEPVGKIRSFERVEYFE